MGSQRLDFAEFYREVKDECLFTVLVSVGDRDTAQDLVDEAFARAWASWRKVSRHPAPQAWVVRTALNTGASWWRRRSRELPLAGYDTAGTGDHGDGLDAGLQTALSRLPARQREVIALRVFLDLDIETTASQLGIAPGTVRAHLSRAVTTLRRELAGSSQTLEVDQ